MFPALIRVVSRNGLEYAPALGLLLQGNRSQENKGWTVGAGREGSGGVPSTSRGEPPSAGRRAGRVGPGVRRWGSRDPGCARGRAENVPRRLTAPPAEEAAQGNAQGRGGRGRGKPWRPPSRGGGEAQGTERPRAATGVAGAGVRAGLRAEEPV